MKRLTAKKIIDEIGSPYLSLVRGRGYWYFVYDDGRKFDTRSVYTFHLNNLYIGEWVAEGRDFINHATL